MYSKYCGCSNWTVETMEYFSCEILPCSHTKYIHTMLLAQGMWGFSHQDSHIPWLNIWHLKAHIHILKRNASVTFPAFLAEGRQLWTVIVHDCFSNWKAHKKELQFISFPLNTLSCNLLFWWLLCSMGFVLFQSFSLKRDLCFRTADNGKKQHVFSRHCDECSCWMNLAHSPPHCHPARCI